MMKPSKTPASVWASIEGSMMMVVSVTLTPRRASKSTGMKSIKKLVPIAPKNPRAADPAIVRFLNAVFGARIGQMAPHISQAIKDPNNSTNPTRRPTTLGVPHDVLPGVDSESRAVSAPLDEP